MSVFNQLRKAATKLGEMVGIDAVQTNQQGGVEGDPLDEARVRVETLRSTMHGMKGTLIEYSRQLLTFSQAAAQVSQEWAGLYSHSPGRSNTLQTFTSNQTKIEQTGFRLYKDNYGWDILKVFDDWDGDAAKMLQDIEKTMKARQRVAGDNEKVRSLRAGKERRLKNNQPLTQKEEAQLEDSEQILEKHSGLLENMRVNLDKSLAHFFESRFSVLDKAFVRFMEMQVEFFRDGNSASANYQSIIDNYRKRFPRQQTNQYGATPDIRSPLPPVNGAEELIHIPAENGTGPVRAKSTPPQPQRDDRDDDRPVARAPPATRPPPPQARNSVPENEESSGSETDSGSDETDSSDDEDGEPTPKKPHMHHHHAQRPQANAEPVIDLFNYPAPAAAPAKPASKPAAPAKSGEDDLVDFFGGGAAKPPPAKKPAASSPSNADFEFDFSGGGGGANNTLAPAKHLPTSSSTPSFPRQKKDDVLAFDPFGMSSPQSKPASSSVPTKARSASPPPAAPGTTQSGLVNAYIPPTHELHEHIATQQEAKVAALNASINAAEEAIEKRKEAEKGLEATLTAWETNKDGNKKNIRNLLSSVHTVLWPNSGWKPVSFADLIDFNAIKKAHMKVIRVVHPDKLTDPTPEQMAIALRVFDSLNTAFDQFKTEQGM